MERRRVGVGVSDRGRVGRALVALFLPLLLPLGVAVPVAAQDATASEAAPTEYQRTIARALEEYEVRQYEEAYSLFTRAHQLEPSARTQRALGKTAFDLRRYVEAIGWLEQALIDTRSPLTEAMRAECEELLARARTYVGHVVVRSSVAGSVVEVDGVVVEGDPTSEAGVDVALALGSHELVVSAPGHDPARRQVTLRGGERDEVTLAPTRREALRVDAPDPGGTMRDLGYASFIAAGAFAVLGAVSLGLWADAVGALNANLSSGLCYADPATESVLPGMGSAAAQCGELESRYRFALPFAWVGFVGAGALLATGLGLVLAAPSRESDGAASLDCGPFGEIGLRCGVTF